MQSIDLMDSLNDMSDKNRKQLKQVLGEKEGLVDLSTLADKGKEIAKEAGVNLKLGLQEMLKKVFIYLSPILGFIFSVAIVFKIIRCCLTNNKRKKKQSTEKPKESPEPIETRPLRVKYRRSYDEEAVEISKLEKFASLVNKMHQENEAKPLMETKASVSPSKRSETKKVSSVETTTSPEIKKGEEKKEKSNKNVSSPSKRTTSTSAKKGDVKRAEGGSKNNSSPKTNIEQKKPTEKIQTQKEGKI